MPTPTLPPPSFSDVPDVELLALVRDFIRDEGGRRHHQATWIDGRVRILDQHPEARGRELALLLVEGLEVCGTRGCVAGWAALFAGWRQEGWTAVVVNPATAQRASMRRAARLSLGLSQLQAAVLFDGSNFRDEVIEIIDRIIADPTDQLPDLYRARDIDPEEPTTYSDTDALWT